MRRTPANQTPPGPGAQALLEQLHEVVTDAEDGEEVSAVDITLIIQKAMELERGKTPNPADAIHVLSAASRVVADDGMLSMILNNLACVEKRRGRAKIALLHLERAADLEGGLEEATPSTLLNLSATHAALGQFAESAALAHHAIHKLSATEDIKPEMRAAAYHNLAVALEGSNDVEHARVALQSAVSTLPDDHPLHATMVGAVNDFDVRHAPPKSDEDDDNATPKNNESKKRSLVKSTARALRRGAPVGPANNNTSVNTSTKSHHLPPLEKPSTLNDSTASCYLASQPRSRTKFERLRREPTRSNSAPLTGDVYTAPSSKKTNNSTSSSSPVAMPAWNADPQLNRKAEESPYTVKQIGKNFDVERRVDEQYIPKHLVPLVEDLRYKETTRRTALTKEWKRTCAELQAGMRLMQLSAAEDESRNHTIVDEVRQRQVLERWIRGKLLFSQGSLSCEKEEIKERESFIKEADDASSQTIVPYWNEIRKMAQEEKERLEINRQQHEDFMHVVIQHEQALAIVQSKQTMRQSNRGFCAAFSVWAFETALGGAQPSLECVDPSLRSSLHVSERYVLFGLPQHAVVPAAPPAAASSSTSSPPSPAIGKKTPPVERQ